MSSSQEREVRIVDKFFYAGHSARLMFHHTVETIMTKLRAAVDSVCDFEQTLKMAGGRSSDQATNTIVYLVQGNPVIVSQFAMRLLIDKASDNVVRILRSYAMGSNNPSFDGWVFEYEVLARFKRPNLRVLSVASNETIKWPSAGRFIYYSKLADLEVCFLFYARFILILESSSHRCLVCASQVQQ